MRCGLCVKRRLNYVDVKIGKKNILTDYDFL